MAEVTQTMDALVWAQDFMTRFGGNRREVIDTDLMLTWFANAIMTGYDHAKREDEELVELLNDARKVLLLVKSSTTLPVRVAVEVREMAQRIADKIGDDK